MDWCFCNNTNFAINRFAIKWSLLYYICKIYFMVLRCLTPRHFNNISVITWQAVFLVEEHGENHRPVASYWQTLLHNFVSSTSRLSGIQTPNVSGDRHWLHIVLGSYKSNYHIITTMTAPARYMISVIKYVFNNITIKLKSSQALFTIIYGNMA